MRRVEKSTRNAHAVSTVGATNALVLRVSLLELARSTASVVLAVHVSPVHPEYHIYIYNYSMEFDD